QGQDPALVRADVKLIALDGDVRGEAIVLALGIVEGQALDGLVSDALLPAEVALLGVDGVERAIVRLYVEHVLPQGRPCADRAPAVEVPLPRSRLGVERDQLAVFGTEDDQAVGEDRSRPDRRARVEAPDGLRIRNAERVARGHVEAI